MLAKFAKNGLINFRRRRLSNAILCATVLSLLHSNRGFFTIEGTTSLANFLSGCDSLTSMGATLDAAFSRWLTKPTNANVGYDSPPLSMAAIRAVVVECDDAACNFRRQPSHSVPSWIALTRKPAIIASVLDLRLCCGRPGKYCVVEGKQYDHIRLKIT